MQQRRAGLGLPELYLGDEVHCADRADHRQQQNRAGTTIGAAGLGHGLAEEVAHALVGVLGGGRLGQHRQRQRHHEVHREDHRETPEAGRDTELVVERCRPQHQHRDADGIDDDRQRARSEQGVERIAGGLLPVLDDRQFLVIARHQLYAVGGRPCRNQERDRQRQGLEIDAHHRHEAEAPDRRQRNAEQRQCDAVEATEIDDQQGRQQRHRPRQDLDDLVDVGVDPAGQHRIAGDVDAMARLLEFMAHALQRVEGGLVVEVALVQLRLDQRRLEVGRHQQAVHRRVGDDVLLDLLELGHAERAVEWIVVGLGLEAAVLVDEDLA